MGPFMTLRYLLMLMLLPGPLSLALVSPAARPVPGYTLGRRWQSFVSTITVSNTLAFALPLFLLRQGRTAN
eukprot:4037822-Pyramimonas_sp.AAC.1